MKQYQYIEKALDALDSRNNMRGTDFRAVLQGLLNQHYGDPRRGYHNLDHVEAMLQHLYGIPAHWNDDAMKLAVMFHDALKDQDVPGKSDEQMSADLAVVVTRGMGFNAAAITDIRMLILTTDYQALPNRASVRNAYPFLTNPKLERIHLIRDLDFGTALGGDPHAYLKYLNGIYREYFQRFPSHTPKDFQRHRKEFLLRLPKDLYHTDYAKETFEKNTRHNITSELETIECVLKLRQKREES